MPDRTTARQYSGTPGAQREFLDDFKVSHPEKSMAVDGTTWTYFNSREGRRVLLLLHGGFAAFDMWIHQITAFEKHYRIIAPTCPVLPNATMKAYSNALLAILEREGVHRLSMIGYSEGGLIAQCFLRDHPRLVDKAVLAHTFYPSTESRYYRHDFTLFRVLPSVLTELVFKLLAKPDREELEAESAEWLDWYRGYFRELKSRLTKDVIITHIDLMIDFVRNYTFHPDDLSTWEGDMLITVSEDDVVLRYFDGLTRLYPDAQSHVFRKGLGAHSIALISPAVFNRRIRAFLEE